MSEFRRRLMMQSKADNPILKDYLTIVSLEDGLTAKLSTNACEYCVDGDGVWKTLPANTDTEPINAGQTLSFRGNLTPASNVGIGTFTINKYHNLKGNCMSMLFADDGKHNFSLDGKNYAFWRLFYNCKKVVNALELLLSATTLSDWCYLNMFKGCISLITIPKLPAKALAHYCYSGMFYGCSSLAYAQELPATSLAYSCYGEMFRACTSLIVAPELKSTKLVGECYRYMFNGCSNLNYIKALFTNEISSALSNWVNGVSTIGTFIKSKNATWDVVGVNGVPEGWTVITE